MSEMKKKNHIVIFYFRRISHFIDLITSIFHQWFSLCYSLFLRTPSFLRTQFYFHSLTPRLFKSNITSVSILKLVLFLLYSLLSLSSSFLSLFEFLFFSFFYFFFPIFLYSFPSITHSFPLLVFSSNFLFSFSLPYPTFLQRRNVWCPL